MSAERETLGSAIHAGRLRYYWSEKCGAYIQLTDVDDGFRFDVCLPSQLPRKVKDQELHRIWWDSDDLRREVGTRVSAIIENGRLPVTFVLDEHGEMVR